VVLEAVYGAGGAVERFAADYEQHCSNAVPALFGSVRYNSTLPVAPRLFAGPASVTEGNSDTVSLNLPVWLSEPLTGAASVGYATADGTATGGADYTSISGTLNFPAGTVSSTATVLVNGDILDEANETLDLVLSGPSGAVLGTDRGTGTILDDDPMPQLAIADTGLAEGDPGRPGTVLFPVHLTAASGQTVCFNYSTLQGTAQVGADFVNTFGSACFPAGITSIPLYVPLVGDLVPEADEDFTLTLTGVVNATVLDGQGAGVIFNDDNPTDFFTLTPCRILDTRQSAPVGANTILNFAAAGLCGVPATAKAVVVNITSVAPTHVGNLRLFPAGSPAPLAAVLVFAGGRTLAGNAVATLGADGRLAVQCDMPVGSGGSAHVVVDVFGYFE
jgi:hypothetical protein